MVIFNGYSIAIQNWCYVMCNVGFTQCHKPSPKSLASENWGAIHPPKLEVYGRWIPHSVRLCLLILSGGARRSQSVGLCPAFVRPKIFRCGDGFDDSHRPWVIFGWLVYWNPFLLTCSIFDNYYCTIVMYDYDYSLCIYVYMYIYTYIYMHSNV